MFKANSYTLMMNLITWEVTVYKVMMVCVCKLIFCGGVVASENSGRQTQDRPNILWITSEDNGVAWIGCYGSKNAKTPAINQLASEGFRYTNCFSNAAVCAPSRSTWITGMHAISNGTQPMRSRYDIPHDTIPYYPDQLRKAGYHVSNASKTDYNIGGRDDNDCWDTTLKLAHWGDIDRKNRCVWRARDTGQPFFAVLNLISSHESRSHGDVDNTITDPSKMVLRSYHPDLPDIRKTYAKYADAISRMDVEVADIVAQLKKDGLYEETIIIYNSDHAGVLARSKRFLYNSGTHCPLIIRIPQQYKHLWPADKPGMTVDRLVSFVDMPKTWLSLAGAEIPDTFQGTVFLGKGAEKEEDYHFSYRARADDRMDMVRMIRDKQFAYYKNYMPFAPAGQYLPYQWRQKASQAWERHHRAGKTDDISGRFFKTRVSEEFYDASKDDDNVSNKINVPEYAKKIAILKTELRKQQLKYYDSGLIPEEMRVLRAKVHNMTIYEMVRDPELYPLEKYLDCADLALERNVSNMDVLIKGLTDEDVAIRYWSVVGLHLLENNASTAAAALEAVLNDDAGEVQAMAAWTLIRLGRKEKGLAKIKSLLFTGSTAPIFVHNVLDWAGEDAIPLLKEYAQSGKEIKGWFRDIITRNGIALKK